MKRLHGALVFALATLATAAAGCAAAETGADESTGRTSQAIIDGKPSPASQDEVVLLAKLDGGEVVSTCTGTLLAPNLVLTALHCVAETDLSAMCDAEGNAVHGAGVHGVWDARDLVVVVGRDVADAPKERVARGAKILTDGARVLCNHDIALVVLDHAIAGAKIAPVRLDAPTKVGEALTSVGWGLTEDGKSPTSRLTRAGVRVASVGPIDTIGKAELEVGESVCSGDSGGPALAKSGAVVGVASRVRNPWVSADDPNPAAFCMGGHARPAYTMLAPFQDLILSAYEAAGAKPWKENAPPPWAKAIGDTCTESDDCAAGVCYAAGGRAVCTAECETTECATGFTCQVKRGKSLCLPPDKALTSATTSDVGAPASGTEPTPSGCSASTTGLLGSRPPVGAIALALGLATMALGRRRTLSGPCRGSRRG